MQESAPYLQRQVERRAMERTIMSFFGVKFPWDEPDQSMERHDQAIGQACAGQLTERCGVFFGDKLSVACRSCPGPS